ncbi:MAG: response regulator [Gammaproteobacteria bacterium]
MTAKLKILIVEDEQAILTGLVDVFVYHGFDVDAASDGGAGLAKLWRNRYDLVILDIMLPTRDGFSICNEIRRRDRDQPILLLTAKTADEDVVTGHGDFSFYRKVRRDRQRYVQGFVVEGPSSCARSSRAPSAVRHCGIGPPSSSPTATGSSAATAPHLGTLLLRTALAVPLEAIRIVFSVNVLPLGSGARLVNGMGICLFVLIPGVLYGVYRFGRAHIELAQERSNFVSAVSHELKTPLTSIRMYGEILRSGWVESEERKRSYYDFIFFESGRLSRLIANVLQLARLANHDSVLALKPYEPDRVLELIRSKVQSQIEAAGFDRGARRDGPPGLAIVALPTRYRRPILR